MQWPWPRRPGPGVARAVPKLSSLHRVARVGPVGVSVSAVRAGRPRAPRPFHVDDPAGTEPAAVVGQRGMTNRSVAPSSPPARAACRRVSRKAEIPAWRWACRDRHEIATHERLRGPTSSNELERLGEVAHGVIGGERRQGSLARLAGSNDRFGHVEGWVALNQWWASSPTRGRGGPPTRPRSPQPPGRWARCDGSRPVLVQGVLNEGVGEAVAAGRIGDLRTRGRGAAAVEEVDKLFFVHRSGHRASSSRSNSRPMTAAVGRTRLARRPAGPPGSR